MDMKENETKCSYELYHVGNIVRRDNYSVTEEQIIQSPSKVGELLPKLETIQIP